MHQTVQDKFSQYPTPARRQLSALRQRIFDIAEQLSLGEVSESLKWGQPSYSVKSGSPIRMDWSADAAERCYLYFHCQTVLVETFRELYSDSLVFEGNRAIAIPLNAAVNDAALSHCLKMALTYKKIKHLPLLGA